MKKMLYIGAIGAALLQSGILYASIEKRASVLRSGQDVVLRTQPIDPRDLMRGDYVVLSYEISNVARDAIQGAPAGDARTVHVAVKRGTDGVWAFSRAAFAPIADLAPDEVQLRGEAAYAISDADTTVRLNYGIERYYVPEGQGRAIEDGQRERRIAATVAVDGSGTAVIKSLSDEGRQLYDEPLY